MGYKVHRHYHYPYPYFSTIAATTILTSFHWSESVIFLVLLYSSKIFCPPALDSKSVLTNWEHKTNICILKTVTLTYTDFPFFWGCVSISHKPKAIFQLYSALTSVILKILNKLHIWQCSNMLTALCSCS